MSTFAPQQCHWVVESLLHAGLDLDRIKGIVFRMGFEGIVAEYRGTPASITAVVRDQPVEVQRAWHAVIVRLLALQEATP